MTTYSEITAGEVDVDSPLTTSLAQKWSDNVLAIIEGDATAVSAGKQIANAAIADATINGGKLIDATVNGGKLVDATVNGGKLVDNTLDGDKILSGSIDTAKYAAASVDQTAIGSGAVHQAELDTSPQDITSISSDGKTVLTGGAYGFHPQIKHATLSGSSDCVVHTYRAVALDAAVASYTAYIAYQITSMNLDIRQTYINSSPPFDLGDGEVPLFVYALYGSDGKLKTVSASDCPPWAYNGPTNISGKITNEGISGGGRLVKTQLKKTIDYKTGKVSKKSIEITNDIKNADMSLIPHPFLSAMPSDTIILLDPCETLDLLDIQQTGESISSLFCDGYLSVNNDNLKRSAPPGVEPKKFKWKNKGTR